MKLWIFMHGGLMSDTVTKYMQDIGHTNCDIRSETTCKNFVDNINQYFNLYMRNKLIENQAKIIGNNINKGTILRILWDRVGQDITLKEQTSKCNDINKLKKFFNDPNLLIGVAHCAQNYHLNDYNNIINRKIAYIQII